MWVDATTRAERVNKESKKISGSDSFRILHVLFMHKKITLFINEERK